MSVGFWARDVGNADRLLIAGEAFATMMGFVRNGLLAGRLHRHIPLLH